MENASAPISVTAAELALRRDRMAAIDNALAQEGLVPSDEGRAIGDRYVAGEVTIEAAIATLNKRYRKPAITADERAARQAAVDFARGSVRFEGHVLDAAVEDLNRRYVAGELSQDEFTQALLRSAGIPPA